MELKNKLLASEKVSDLKLDYIWRFRWRHPCMLFLEERQYFGCHFVQDVQTSASWPNGSRQVTSNIWTGEVCLNPCSPVSSCISISSLTRILVRDSTLWMIPEPNFGPNLAEWIRNHTSKANNKQKMIQVNSGGAESNQIKSTDCKSIPSDADVAF